MLHASVRSVGLTSRMQLQFLFGSAGPRHVTAASRTDQKHITFNTHKKK